MSIKHLCLFWFKTRAECRRSGESDNDTEQSLWQREGNYTSGLKTNQKRGSDLGVPKLSHVAAV